MASFYSSQKFLFVALVATLICFNGCVDGQDIKSFRERFGSSIKRPQPKREVHSKDESLQKKRAVVRNKKEPSPEKQVKRTAKQKEKKGSKGKPEKDVVLGKQPTVQLFSLPLGVQ